MIDPEVTLITGLIVEHGEEGEEVEPLPAVNQGVIPNVKLFQIST